MGRLTFAQLREANVRRDKEWDPTGLLTPLFRSTELAGEVGEICNKIKKLEREKLGLRGSRATVAELAEEIGDAMITLDLLAIEYGIDIDAVTVRKFNKSSEELGLSIRLPE